MVGKFSHSEVGPIRFYQRDPDCYTGSRIRGTKLLVASPFNGAIYQQQYVNSSFTIFYIDFELPHPVQLQWQTPSFNYFLIFVLEGKIAFDAGSNTATTLTKGHCACLPTLPQTLQLLEEEPANILLIASNSNNPFEQDSLPDRLPLVLPFPAPMKLLLTEFFSNEYNELLLDLYYEKVVKDLLFCFLVSLQEKHANSGRSAIPEPIKAAHDLILHSNRATHFSLADLAALTGISESTLKKGYKKYYGTSPFDHQVLLRLKWAREQLETTDLPTSELFRPAGYAHAVQGFEKGISNRLFRIPHSSYKIIVGMAEFGGFNFVHRNCFGLTVSSIKQCFRHFQMKYRE